jgi:hypothetical protein
MNTDLARVLFSALELINKEAEIIHEKLGKIHPDFADYLKLLDIKVNLLATTVIRIAGDDAHKNQTRNANISVTGIGFDCEEWLDIGQYLELKILLVHSTVVMTAYAKIIHHFEYTNPKSPSPSSENTISTSSAPVNKMPMKAAGKPAIISIMALRKIWP